MYEIIIPEPFARELQKLEDKEQKRIKKKLVSAKNNPWLYFQRLTGHELFRARIGKYRVIASFSAREKKIYCLSVMHRKNAYKKL